MSVLLLICCCMYVVPPQFLHRDLWVCSTIHKMHMNSLIDQWSKYWEISTLLHIVYISECIHFMDCVFTKRKWFWWLTYLCVICKTHAKVSWWQTEVFWHWTEKPQLWRLSWPVICVVLHCLMSAVTVCVLNRCVSCMLLCLWWTGALSRWICRTVIVFSFALFWNRKTFAQHPF